jgi:hypothetical protein
VSVVEPRIPIGKKRDRFLVILAGVVGGYVLGLVAEERYAWQNARSVPMVLGILGGLLSGVIARFTLQRFRD